MVTMRSSGGMQAERAFKNVVFPDPVPPLMKMLYLARTSTARKAAASSDRASSSTRRFMVMGSGNFRMVRAGPSKATGGSTTCTREPSGRRASAMGSATFTTRFTRLTICWMVSSSCSSDSKQPSHRPSRPFCSTKIRSFPFTMISVMSFRSIISWRIPSLRKESNSRSLSSSRSGRGKNSAFPSSSISPSMTL